MPAGVSLFSTEIDDIFTEGEDAQDETTEDTSLDPLLARCEEREHVNPDDPAAERPL